MKIPKQSVVRPVIVIRLCKILFTNLVFSIFAFRVCISCYKSEINKMANLETELSTLKDCFLSIIEGKQLEVDVDSLNSVLKKNLQVNFNLLKPKLVIILPYMLVHFMKTWPGWKKCTPNQISVEGWFQKFKEYLLYKINFLIKNDFYMAQAMLKNNPLLKIDNSTQTNIVGEKEIAPFSIAVDGSPKLLNSLVFCEGIKDSILLREYRVNTAWTLLTPHQLINWPYIEIEFKSKHLHFTRSNRHHFNRFLTFSSEKIGFKKNESFIESVEILDENTARQAYTLNAIKEYCKAYINLLRTYKAIIDWSMASLEEIEIILEDFILDIIDVNMGSIATNTSVLFNIGKSAYARNKSIKATSDQSVCYAEFITPKILLALVSFTAIKDANSATPFEDLHTINPRDVHTLLPTITYTCTFCQTSHNTFSETCNHLQLMHLMEQPVLCFRCKSQYKITNLTDIRWYHHCNAEKKNHKT